MRGGERFFLPKRRRFLHLVCYFFPFIPYIYLFTVSVFVFPLPALLTCVCVCVVRACMVVVE